jgi:hypothetical protein
MSDVAAIGGLETTIGLMPRHLRNRASDDASGGAAERRPGDETSTAEGPASEPGMRVASLTDELRRRIVEAATPEKHGPRPLWFGVAAVAVIVLVCLMFPDAIAALLPDVDTSL